MRRKSSEGSRCDTGFFAGCSPSREVRGKPAQNDRRQKAHFVTVSSIPLVEGNGKSSSGSLSAGIARPWRRRLDAVLGGGLLFTMGGSFIFGYSRLWKLEFQASFASFHHLSTTTWNQRRFRIWDLRTQLENTKFVNRNVRKQDKSIQRIGRRQNAFIRA